MFAYLKTRHWTVIGSLLTLFALGIVGLVLTREQDNAKPGGQARRAQLVNLSFAQTARQLAASASSRDEQRLARQALRSADHEVDLAFAMAMRDATQQRAQVSSEARTLYERVQKAQSVATAEQDQVDLLKKQLAAAAASRKDVIQQRINLAEAQLELDQDELEDAQADLMRSGVDMQTRLQRQFSRYQATAQHDQDLFAAQNTDRPETDESSTFLAQFSLWKKLQGKASQLHRANQDASAAADKLRDTHNQLEQQLHAQETARQSLKQQANSQLQADGNADAVKTTIASFHEFADKQKSLSDLDKRIQDCQELSDTYTSWRSTSPASSSITFCRTSPRSARPCVRCG